MHNARVECCKLTRARAPTAPSIHFHLILSVYITQVEQNGRIITAEVLSSDRRRTNAEESE